MVVGGMRVQSPQQHKTQSFPIDPSKFSDPLNALISLFEAIPSDHRSRSRCSGSGLKKVKRMRWSCDSNQHEHSRVQAAQVER